jgi:Regulator of ribonuclease activity B
VALFRRKRNDQPVDLNERSPDTGLKYKDILVLGQLMQAGADLKQPRHAVYYLYFDDRDTAVAAAETARERAFDAEVREPLAQYPEQWSVVCEVQGVILDPARVLDHGDFFDSLAQTYGGEYDGWEASV